MNLKIVRSARALEMPLNTGPRLLLFVAIALVLNSYAMPLWNLTEWGRGGQGDGLRVSIYSHTLRMAPHPGEPATAAVSAGAAWAGLEPSGWIAIGLAAMALLFLRAALLGTTRSLIDASVLYIFFAAASLWSFSLQLFRFARHLAPGGTDGASIMGLLFGDSKIGGVELAASPGAGAWTLGVVALVLVAALLAAWKSAREEFTAECLVAG